MASGRNQHGTHRRCTLIFRNRQGQSIDAEQAEALMKAEGLEVCSDVFEYDRQKVMVKSKLQPVCHDEGEPLFLTMVFGDAKLGHYELPTDSEAECRTLHRSLVDRYLVIEAARADTPRVLIQGVL